MFFEYTSMFRGNIKLFGLIYLYVYNTIKLSSIMQLKYRLYVRYVANIGFIFYHKKNKDSFHDVNYFQK